MNDSNMYDLCDLFAQLGMDSSVEAIGKFIDAVAPIPDHVPLHEADCWDDAQATFLREAISEDAEWAVLVEKLDARLRE